MIHHHTTFFIHYSQNPKPPHFITDLPKKRTYSPKTPKTPQISVFHILTPYIYVTIYNRRHLLMHFCFLEGGSMLGMCVPAVFSCQTSSRVLSGVSSTYCVLLYCCLAFRAPFGTGSPSPGTWLQEQRVQGRRERQGRVHIPHSTLID
jgi:hypothetical protein